VIGIASAWLGILLAYDSYDWYDQSGKSWPVSFFVVTLIFAGYLLAGLPRRLRRRAPRPDRAGEPARG
jgi:zinc/manganese transport system permease protein